MGLLALIGAAVVATVFAYGAITLIFKKKDV